MKIAVVSANLGGFEKPVHHVEQSVPCDIITITDKEFPPRHTSMTPRLQARIVKTHMWDFAPGYDFYIWVDSSCAMTDKDAVKWLLGELGGANFAVFRHPDRSTIQDEAAYLKDRLALERAGKKAPYLLERYDNEDIDGQIAVIGADYRLLASTVFACHRNIETEWATEKWWYHISRFHSIDQLSFSYALESTLGTSVMVLGKKEPYFTYVRNKV